jgi:hypothetical protein
MLSILPAKVYFEGRKGMSRNPFSHIDLRVRNLGEATGFYRKFLPAIGFRQWRGEEPWRGGSASRSFIEKNEKMYEK